MKKPVDIFGNKISKGDFIYCTVGGFKVLSPAIVTSITPMAMLMIRHWNKDNKRVEETRVTYPNDQAVLIDAEILPEDIYFDLMGEEDEDESSN